MGLAVVVRDHMGKMVVAGYKTRKGCLEPTTAEACAALMATRKCKELHFTRVHFEGDAKVVVDAVLSEKEDRSRLGNVIEEICTVPHWKSSFVTRDANKAVVYCQSLLCNRIWTTSGWFHPTVYGMYCCWSILL